MKLNFKSVSILSIVLMGASAVTAAIVPTKSSDLRVQGSISNLGTNDGVTCTPTDVVNNTACNASTAAGSATTVAGKDNSYEGAAQAQTEGNTTTK